MTRAQMRVRLQRRLQDTTDELWDTAALNELLNDGLREIQKRILLVDPYFLIYIDRADVVAGEPRIKKPVGFLYEFKLERKADASSDYKRIKRFDDEDASNVASGAVTSVYSHDGQYLKVSPTPGVSLSNGYQLTWMPTLTMAADSDVADVIIMLHLAVVLAAQLIALGDTGIARDAVAMELETHAAPEIIARYYQRSAADLDQLQAEFGKPRY